ncbi:F-box protein At4g00755-like [Lolium rigidum]|uniref:F-box protein At4g00755-like n=1 Tax=Lolium rigidum TaxID=89674 RepID=UPI001F5C5077|nr:F-box protein At4g00755-like [Lolium rigidum]
MAAAECCGGDFLDWVGPDNSASVFGLLDNPADLVRAAAVSRTWRRFVIENDLSKSLCVRLFPEVATIAAAAEVTRSPPSPPVSQSQSDSERAYRIYSNLAGALVSSSPKDSTGCVLRCVGASSTDDFPNETMVHTLHERGLVNFRPSYWSSCGSDNPDEPESLTYRLNSDFCIVDEIRVQPFKAFFQYGNPIYSSKTVRFRMGHYKLPRGSESFVTNDDENKMVNAEKDYMWTYTSPEFPMSQENVLQSFKLPRPVLCIGGVVMIELLGRVQKQGADDKYYICVCHVEVIGRSLSPLFMVDISDPGGYSILKYLPGAKNLSAEDMAQYDTEDSLEWQYFGARYRQMNHIAVLNALLMQVHFMHEDDVGWVLQDGLLL